MLVLMVLVISCSIFQKSEDQLFNSGVASLQTGDFYGAIEHFNNIDSLYPDSPYGQYGRAIAYEQDRRTIDALNEYLRILSKNNDFAPGLKGLALLAAKTDHQIMALEIASQYGKAEDDSLVTTELMAELLYYIGEYQLAREQLDKIISDPPSHPEHLLLLSKLLEMPPNQIVPLEKCQQALNGNLKNI